MTQTSNQLSSTADLNPGAIQTIQVTTSLTVKNTNANAGGSFTTTVGSDPPQSNTLDPGTSTTLAFQNQQVQVHNTGQTILNLTWT